MLDDVSSGKSLGISEEEVSPPRQLLVSSVKNVQLLGGGASIKLCLFQLKLKKLIVEGKTIKIVSAVFSSDALYIFYRRSDKKCAE